MASPTVYSPEYLAENDSASLLSACIALLVLETIFVGLYFVSHFMQKLESWTDIFLTLMGYVCNLGMLISNFLLVQYAGAGRHVVAVMIEDPYKIVIFSKIELAAQVFYNPAVTLPKLVIIRLYLKIFRNKWFRFLTYLTGIVIILTCVALELTTFLQCHPFAYYWDKTFAGGHCGDLMLQFKVAAIPNLVTDLAILVLPIPVVWKLNASTARKVGLTVTFLTGSFGIVTCIIRLYYFFAIDLFADPTYNSIPIGTWVFVEPGVYLIASTLPFLRPLGRSFAASNTFRASRIYLTNLVRRSSSASSDSNCPTINGNHVTAMNDHGPSIRKLQPRIESMSLSVASTEHNSRSIELQTRDDATDISDSIHKSV